MENKHLFGLKLVSNKVYSLVISGVEQVVFWVQNIPMKFTITAGMSLGALIRQNIGMANNFVITMRALERVSSNFTDNLGINISKISALMKLSTDVNSKMMLLINVSYTRALYRVSAPFTDSLNMAATLVVATLIRLDAYDASTLGTLDPQTLGALEAIIL